MHKRICTHTALVAGWLTFASIVPSLSGEPRLLWQDTVDESSFDQAFDVATLGDRVYVAGFVGVPGAGRDFLLRAYDAPNGTLLWQNRVDRGTNDFAAGVVAAGRTVFVSGAAGSDCCPDWLIRAHNADTGELLWENSADLSGRADFPRPSGLAVTDGLLIVVGSANETRRWVVRAYNVANGKLVWQHEYDRGVGLNGAESLVVRPGRVFVGGFAASASSDEVVVRAYDSRTGRLLWQHETSGPNSCCTTMRGLGTDGTRIFAAATVANASRKPSFVVLALDAESGLPVWQDWVDNGGRYDAANGIAVRGSQVFAQGFGGRQCLGIRSPPSDCDILIRSYDATTGALLWDVKAGTQGIDDQAPPQVIVAQSGMLFGAWQANMPSEGAKGDWLVQGYQSATGQLLWEDQVDTGGGSSFEGAEIPLRVAFSRGRLFVVGRTVDAADNWNFAVRAYSVTGEQSDEDDVQNNSQTGVASTIVRAGLGQSAVAGIANVGKAATRVGKSERSGATRRD